MKKATAFLAAIALGLFMLCARADDVSELTAAGMALNPSDELWFEEGLAISAMGIHLNQYPLAYDGCYFFPAIRALTNAKISADWRSSSGYATQIAVTLASGKLPDIITPSDNDVMYLVSEGAILALDDYLELIPNVVSAVGEDRMTLWRQADGHIYTIPSVVGVQGAQSMMVRKDWLDQLGMDVPQTWDEWLAAWRAFKKNDMNGDGDPDNEIPLVLEQGQNGERSMAMLLNAFGIRASADCQFCLLDDGTYTMVYVHPRYAEFLQTVSGMFAEGLIDAEFVTREQAALFAAMDSGLAGSAVTWAEHAKLGSYACQDEKHPNALWLCVPPVAGPYGDRFIEERNLTETRWCLTVNAQNEGKVEDILRLFNWCYGPEGIALYNYGIEGLTYDVQNGRPVLRPSVVCEGFLHYRELGLEYEPFGGKWLEDAFMQCLLAGQSPDELDEASRSFYDGLFTVNDGYFYVAPATLATDAYAEHRSSLITTGVCVLRDQAIAGQISQEAFWEGYERLKEAGLNEVISEGAAAYARQARATG